MTGEAILKAAQELVITTLKEAPDGLTNAEIIKKTRLVLEVPSYRSFITWTILQNLVLTGRAKKEGHGRDARYLAPRTDRHRRT